MKKIILLLLTFFLIGCTQTKKEEEVIIQTDSTIEKISYTAHLKRQDQTLEKEAYVYLPKNYDQNKKYDVMYLFHGYGGHNYTFLGTKDKPREFTQVLDENTKDMIVVTSTITYERDNSEDCINYYSDEIINDLIPTVENTYSTYQNRNHRIMQAFH